MPIKHQIFTTTTDWPVPASVSGIWGTWIGGGSGGAANPGIAIARGVEGGSSGEFGVMMPIVCTPGGTVSVIIGAGGIPGHASPNTAPGAGGFSQVASFKMLGGRASTDGINGAHGGGTRGGLSYLLGGGQEQISAGTAESPTTFGGAGAGLGAGNGTSGGASSSPIGISQVIGEYPPLPGAPTGGGCHGGGGNGAPSMFGLGGHGGEATDANNGAGGAPTASTGAGGGGGCGTGNCAPPLTATEGATGAAGYAILYWTEP